jgi:3-hydroxyacyl-CoA dehydrogenase
MPPEEGRRVLALITEVCALLEEGIENVEAIDSAMAPNPE